MPATHDARADALRVGLVATLAVLAAACGSGGDDTTPAPPPAATSLAITGTAATGAAMAGGTVEAKCATGTASASTAADGSYTLAVTDGTLPCVLRVTSGATVLHSLAAGSGSSVRANLTPATELAVARLVQAAPASYWTTFVATVATDSAIATALADVVAVLKDAGVDFSALGNLFTAPLVARNGGSAGNAYDQALDALAGAMATAGTTLPALADAVAGNTSGSASLPPDLLLRRAASGCSVLRSTTYRVVEPSATAGTVDAQVGTLVFDAATMTGTRSGSAAASWTATAPCRFTESGNGYSADVMVSQGGLLVGLVTRGTTTHLFFGYPAQSHTLAELAGPWNQLGMGRSGAAFAPFAGSATLDAAGRVTAGTSCGNATTWAIDTCTALGDTALALLPALGAAGDGSFQVTDAASGRVTTRLFAYRAGSRDLMLASIAEDGAFGFWSPDKAVPLPAVGTPARNWNFDVNAELVPYPLSETTNTVTANNTAAGTWTRTQSLANTPTVTYVTTLRANQPRRGYVLRPSATVTASDGRTVTLNEFSFLRLHGMGWSPVVIPGPKTFEPSVGQPLQ